MGITNSGIVGIVGKPNVGKSTLLNRLVGQKVAIVANRPQTTRNRILGIANIDNTQILYLDTPGLHSPKTKLGDYMMREANSGFRDVDLVLLIVEPTEVIEDVEINVLERAKDSGYPVILVINKIDTVERPTLLPIIDSYSKLYEFEEIMLLSAERGTGVEDLSKKIIAMMPEGPAYFPEDAYTDQTERQMVAEFIREKALRSLNKEVPHGLAVEVEEFKEREDGMVDIKAVIYCEKESHKGIVIGKKGAMLKKIASAARYEIEMLLDCKVYLEIFVKVRESWRNSERFLRSVGYKDN